MAFHPLSVDIATYSPRWLVKTARAARMAPATSITPDMLVRVSCDRWHRLGAGRQSPLATHGRTKAQDEQYGTRHRDRRPCYCGRGSNVLHLRAKRPRFVWLLLPEVSRSLARP